MYKDSTSFNVVVRSLLPIVKKCFCLTVLEYCILNNKILSDNKNSFRLNLEID